MGISNNGKSNIHGSIIQESLVLTEAKLKRYDNIICSISGGSDSDVLIDLCEKLKSKNKINYVFFDTGLEFQATKDHLDYLEKKYNVKIERVKAVKPIPISCKEYGQPFLSKQVSEWISRLQRNGFKWEDKSFKELYREYPNCKAALRWWCNKFSDKRRKNVSAFDINYHKYLKDFMIENPPTFKISNKCCLYAKKKVASNYKKNNKCDLSIYGVRKSEGGARKNAYKTCFSEDVEGCDEFRPIFWYLNETKQEYIEKYDIKNSDCYSIYGLKRTGCAGCPYSRNFENELKIMKKYEPQMYKAVRKIFADSYRYTRKYRKFVEEKKKNE